MVKLANKSVDKLLLSEYLGDYEKWGTKLNLRTSLTLTFPYFSWLGWFRHCLYAEKNFGVGKTLDFPDPFFWKKLGTWVLLSTVFVQEKVPSGQSKYIRHKTLDLCPSYLFYIRYVSHPSTYVGFNTYTLNFYLRPTVNYSNECHFLLKSPTSVGIK